MLENDINSKKNQNRTRTNRRTEQERNNKLWKSMKRAQKTELIENIRKHDIKIRIDYMNDVKMQEVDMKIVDWKQV